MKILFTSTVIGLILSNPVGEESEQQSENMVVEDSNDNMQTGQETISEEDQFDQDRYISKATLGNFYFVKER